MPNFGAAGRRRRKLVAFGGGVFAFAALAFAIAFDSAWWIRALVFFFPMLAASIAYFEARSSVCVLRAAQGTFEHDDLSQTLMESSLLPSIRRVATTVGAKGILLTALLTFVAALSSRFL
jgi:hypothetical protein